MSIEKAIIAQARPFMLAAKAQALIRTEVSKGCLPDISTGPVALEPAFQLIQTTKDILSEQNSPHAVPYPPPSPDGIVRMQIWISPDQKFDWNRSELFLKQLGSVSYRLAIEILGNQTEVIMALSCHQEDLPIVWSAFHGEFNQCELTTLRRSTFSSFSPEDWANILFRDYFPTPPYSHLLTQPEELIVSPYETLMTAMTYVPAGAVGFYQILFQPVSPEHNWYRNVQIIMDLEYISKLHTGMQVSQFYTQQSPSGDLRQMSLQTETKAHNDKPFYATAFRIGIIGAEKIGRKLLQSLATPSNLFQHGGRPLAYLNEEDYQPLLSPSQIRDMFLWGRTYRPGFLLNSLELTGLVHIPPANFIETRPICMELLETIPLKGDNLSAGTPIGTCEIAGRTQPVYIPPALRGRHTHLIGRPGMGKSCIMEHMILDDLEKGFGVAVIDPHGDLVERLLCLLKDREIERTIYFNPGDPHWVPIWNPIQRIPGQDIGRTADDIVSALKSFVEGWGDRLEHFLRHAFFALLHLDHSTMLDVTHLLRQKSTESKNLRKELLKVVENEVSRQFWLHDFDGYRQDEFGPPRHKLSKLLVSETISLMLSQPNSSFNFRRIMDDGMIFLVDLSSLGSEVRQILGCFVLSLIHLTALSRSDIPMEKRKPFHIYCDEAHRFMTDAMEDLIAETRKYNVSLTLAHQYLKQFGTRKADALSSVGSTIIFNVDTRDAQHLVKDLRGLVKIEDLIALNVGQAVMRCGTDIVRIKTLDPYKMPAKNLRERIIAESRRRYCRPAPEIVKMIRQRYHPAHRPLAALIETSRSKKTRSRKYDVP